MAEPVCWPKGRELCGRVLADRLNRKRARQRFGAPVTNNLFAKQVARGLCCAFDQAIVFTEAWYDLDRIPVAHRQFRCGFATEAGAHVEMNRRQRAAHRSEERSVGKECVST